MRFRLRTLLIVVAGLGLMAGTYANSARRQRRAVDDLRRQRAMLHYRSEADGYADDVWAASSTVDKVKRLLGKQLDINWYDTVDYVGLGDPAEYDLRPLRELPSLRHFQAFRLGELPVVGLLGPKLSTRIEKISVQNARGDDYLRGVDGLWQLRELNLMLSPVTAEQLHSISRLPQLNALTIARTDLADEDLLALRPMPHLREWHVFWTHLTRDGLAIAARRAPNLRVLSADRIQLDRLDTLSPDGRAFSWEWFPCLERLSISDTQLDEEDLRQLARLPRLRYLYMTYTQVGDIAPLIDAPSLEEVWLPPSVRNTASALRLMQQHPNCRVNFLP